MAPRYKRVCIWAITVHILGNHPRKKYFSRMVSFLVKTIMNLRKLQKDEICHFYDKFSIDGLVKKSQIDSLLSKI